MEVLVGALRPVEVPRDDGSTQRIFRCPNCQTAVFSESSGRPELRYVRAGTLDLPSGLMPDVHIFTGSTVGWLTIPESTPGFGLSYDKRSFWPATSLERLGKILA